MNTKQFSLLLLVGALLSGVAVQAKLYTPDFERSFQNQINRHDLAVVHFNPFPEDEEDESALEEMKEGFIDLSKDDRYKKADVAFIGVNLNKLPDLASDYDVAVPDWAAIQEVEDAEAEMDDDQTDEEQGSQEQGSQGQGSQGQGSQGQGSNDQDEDEIEITKDQESTLMLFKDGKPFKDKGKIVKRTGFITEQEIEDFIEAYFGDFIDRLLSERKTHVRQRIAVRQVKPAAQRVSTRYRVGSRPTTRVYRTRTYRRPYYGGYYRRPYFGYFRPWGFRRWGGYGGYGGYGGFGIGFGFGRRGFRRSGFGFGW